METSLHKDLKRLYADRSEQIEVGVGRYRIDAVARGELVEIQHSGLGAIRDKVRDLLRTHRVLVVKPIVRTKVLVKRATAEGPGLSRRRSPKRGRLIDIFDDLVHFVGVFPHERLALELVLVDVEEWRLPAPPGRRRGRWRRAFTVEDVRLTAVREVVRIARAGDLLRLLPERLPTPFGTAHLAASTGTSRGLAQRTAYCLRKTGVAKPIGKHGNARLYELTQTDGFRVSDPYGTPVQYEARR